MPNVFELHSNMQSDSVRDVQPPSLEVHSASVKFLAKRMGTPIPFLPVNSIEERKLFTIMCPRFVDSNNSLKASEFADAWNQKADGINKKYFSSVWKKNANRVMSCLLDFQANTALQRSLRYEG
jgi:hypothetical protein